LLKEKNPYKNSQPKSEIHPNIKKQKRVASTFSQYLQFSEVNIYKVILAQKSQMEISRSSTISDPHLWMILPNPNQK